MDGNRYSTEKTPFSVKHINQYVKRRLDGDPALNNIPVIGEVTGLGRPGPNGHLYFSLADEESVIRCTLWAGNRKRIDPDLLVNGRKVIVTGSIQVYAKGGTYALNVIDAAPAGEGELAARFERLKKKLAEEGLFDPGHKRPFPFMPKRIGVVTSPTGAAVEDIKTTIRKKNDLVDIIIFPAAVQGIDATMSICEGIRAANEYSRSKAHIDVLIVGRGGGSAEDLSCFNDEGVARAVYGSEIPVISAVGHDIDVSISDFVADKSTATPTAAAEFAVPDIGEMRERIDKGRRILYDNLKGKFDANEKMIKLNRDALSAAALSRISGYEAAVDKMVITLKENDPRRIFEKGYAAVTDADGKVISSVDGIEPGDDYKIEMTDGNFIARAVSKNRK